MIRTDIGRCRCKAWPVDVADIEAGTIAVECPACGATTGPMVADVRAVMAGEAIDTAARAWAVGLRNWRP